MIGKLCWSKDNLICVVKLKTLKSSIERPIHVLYLHNLYCDTEEQSPKTKMIVHQILNVNAKELQTQRTAAVTSEIKIKVINDWKINNDRIGAECRDFTPAQI